MLGNLQQKSSTPERLLDPSLKKLKRSYINSRGQNIVSFEGFWPPDEMMAPVIQRICNHMEQLTSPKQIIKRLAAGEKVTTKWGAVYSLVSATAHR